VEDQGVLVEDYAKNAGKYKQGSVLRIAILDEVVTKSINIHALYAKRILKHPEHLLLFCTKCRRKRGPITGPTNPYIWTKEGWEHKVIAENTLAGR